MLNSMLPLPSDDIYGVMKVYEEGKYTESPFWIKKIMKPLL